MTTTTPQRASTTSALRVPVHLWLVIVLMAMSFGAGVIVRTMAEPVPSQAVPQTVLPSGYLAPPLTDQQIGQGLPSGHPTLSGGGATGATGSAGAGAGTGAGTGAGGG